MATVCALTAVFSFTTGIFKLIFMPFLKDSFYYLQLLKVKAHWSRFRLFLH